MLRKLSPHCAAIIIISEAWTLDDPEAVRTLATRVADHPARKEGVFVQVASPLGDLLLTTSFSRDKKLKPIRPIQVNATWQSDSTVGNFQGLFAHA